MIYLDLFKKKMENTFDYIFCGYGLSSSVILHKMSMDEYFINKSILVIESNKKDINKTWCFWDSNNSTWDNFIDKKWSNIKFKNSNTNINHQLSDIRYNMIKSQSFFDQIKKDINLNLNIRIIYDQVSDIKHKSNGIEICCSGGVFLGKKVFNSIPKFSPYVDDKRFPILLQHFKGWTIKTENNSFKSDEATIMDFSINQKNQTRFFYILPINSKEALVEFTLFTKKILDDDEYEMEISSYLKSLNIKKYKISSKETGVIPMTCYPFEKYNSSNLINIGTAGGWTKPSSGYTFRFIDKYSNKLIEFIKTGRSFKKFKLRDRFWFYDLVFLDVLFNKNFLGSSLFETMFKKNNFNSIFRFLDNESSYYEDFKIINSFPKVIFIKSFLKNIPKIISAYL